MSRSRKFFGGLAVNYVYQGVLMVTGLLLTPFLLSRLGQHDYGLWLVGSQLLLYLTLTDFGIVALLPIEVGSATGRAGGAEKADELSVIVGQTTRLVLYQLPVVVLVAVGIWFALPQEWYDLRGPLGLMLLGFVISFPLRILPTLLEGLQDLAFTSSMRILIWAVNTLSIVILIFAHWNLYALASAWVLCLVASTPVYVYRLKTRFPQAIPHGLPSLTWEIAKVHLGKGFWVSVAQVATMLVQNVDLLVIAKLLGPAAVVPYSCTGKLCYVVGNQVTMLMHTAGPGLCEVRAGESRQRMFDIMTALTQATLVFSGAVFCVALLVNHWFVDWWVTGRQFGGLFLTFLFLSNLLIRHWTGVTANTVFYFGHQRRISLTNIGDGILTATATVLFVKLWGVGGALAASMLGAILVSLPLNLTRIASDVGVSIATLVHAMLAGWYWRFACVAGACGWIATHWSPKTLPEGIATAVGATLVYSAIMLPNVLRAPLGNYVRPLLDSSRRKCLAFFMPRREAASILK
jgi:O-antigen/teichoic acid export membrane protein